MPASAQEIAELIASPRESLAVELKSWFDPASAAGKAKIVKAAIALRNEDGGFLMIGFDDKSLRIQTQGAPADVRKDFHPDHIQALVTKYASQRFEIFVHYHDVEGATVVVVQVDGGVRSPVAAKADLKDDSGATLVAKDRVYVRTLSSNNVVSTSEAKHSDWTKLSDICFNNREADVGYFLRRHLVGLSPQTVEALGTALLQAVKPPPPLDSLALALLDEGLGRFSTKVRQDGVSLPKHGSWEIGVRIHPQLESDQALDRFLGDLLNSNPRYTGWPAWVGLLNTNEKEKRPYVFDGGWEALMVSPPSDFSGHVDFWRLDPKGAFYLRRNLGDDLSASSNAPEPMTTLDFALPVLRVAEALAVALTFAQRLGAGSEHSLAIACRWTQLKGRELTSWADFERHIYPGRHAAQDSVASTVVLPADFAPNSLAEPVGRLLRPLYALFDGFSLTPTTNEELVQKLLNRRL